MKQQNLMINEIPAVLWGSTSSRVFVAVHGDKSNKSDEAVVIFAEEAAKKGYQTLSFDLPEHGERQGKPDRCGFERCVEDLKAVMAYARKNFESVGVFGCSLGAYFCMLAYPRERIRQSLFLSPVVDMMGLIRGIMTGFGISEEQLAQAGMIETPVKTLYWEDYCYAKERVLAWDKPTALLCGEKDVVCDLETVTQFAKQSNADITVMAAGEHYFHTAEQLDFYRKWLERTIEN